MRWGQSTCKRDRKGSEVVGRLSQHPPMTYLEGNLLCWPKDKTISAAAAAAAAVFIGVKHKLGARLRGTVH